MHGTSRLYVQCCFHSKIRALPKDLTMPSKTFKSINGYIGIQYSTVYNELDRYMQ
jgi:hypothetical protein